MSTNTLVKEYKAYTMKNINGENKISCVGSYANLSDIDYSLNLLYKDSESVAVTQGALEDVLNVWNQVRHKDITENFWSGVDALYVVCGKLDGTMSYVVVVDDKYIVKEKEKVSWMKKTLRIFK